MGLYPQNTIVPSFLIYDSKIKKFHSRYALNSSDNSNRSGMLQQHGLGYRMPVEKPKSPVPPPETEEIPPVINEFDERHRKVRDTDF